MKSIPAHISSIIFDLGGVILNLDQQKSVQAFARLAGLSEEQVIDRFTEATWLKDFEKGLIGAAEFRQAVRQALHITASDSQIDAAWNAMLLDLPLPRLQLLAGLRPHYTTLVLSNTNEIHLTAFEPIVARTTGGRPLDAFFDAVYYSHLLGMRKPDAEIYDYVLSQHQLLASDTLFIDDMAANIAGAQKVGLQTYQLTNPDRLSNLFAK